MKKVGEITEREVIFLMDEMCMESLSPIGLLRWEEIKHTLETNRKALDTPETPVAKDVIQPKDREALKDRGIHLISCGCNDFKHHIPVFQPTQKDLEVGEVKGVFMTPLEHGDDISERIKKTLELTPSESCSYVLNLTPMIGVVEESILCERTSEIKNIYIEDFDTTEVIEESMPFDKFRNPYKGKKKRRSK